MSAPDSAAWEGQRSEVRATRERDNPAYGSVELLLHTSETSSTSVRITRAIAEILRDQLTDHLSPDIQDAQESGDEDLGYCRSERDGDCNWSECPQLRDGEPKRSGRNCPRIWPER